jgi:hypothetical protein
LETETWKYGLKKQETRNQKPETRNKKQETILTLPYDSKVIPHIKENPIARSGN